MISAVKPLTSRYRFVLYDQRGSLHSPCLPKVSAEGKPISACLDGAEATVDKHVADLELIRKNLGIERLTIVGHSMGSFLALKYQSIFPNHVKKLILVGSLPVVGSINQLSEFEPLARQRFDRPEFLRVLEENALDKTRCLNGSSPYPPIQKSLCHRIIFAATNLYHANKWAELGSSFFYQRYAAYQASSSMQETWDFRKHLVDSNILVHVIHGADDYLPINWVRDSILTVPNAAMHEIPEAGHISWVDKPLLFKNALESALN